LTRSVAGTRLTRGYLISFRGPSVCRLEESMSKKRAAVKAKGRKPKRAGIDFGAGCNGNKKKGKKKRSKK